MITDKEFRALAALSKKYAESIGEDVAGAILSTGGGWVLSDKELVELGTKIEAAKPVTEKPHYDPKFTGQMVFIWLDE